MPLSQTKATWCRSGCTAVRHGLMAVLGLVAGMAGLSAPGRAGVVITNLSPVPVAAPSAPAMRPFHAQADTRPAVLVGDLAGLFNPAVVERMGGWMPVASRDRIRAADEGLFLALLDGGRFDPPAIHLARAIQTELARLGCYNRQVDGVWGRSSRMGMRRFAGAAGLADPGADPDMGMFRAVVLSTDLRCPPVVAPVAPSAAPTAARAAPAVRSGTAASRAAPGRATPNTVAPSRRAPPSAAAPTPPPAGGGGPQINRGLLGTGVFR
ncbi:peptidoglycan-binding domain-containing protein [Paracoccus jiaweipingae]|uniref:peptidoglycan-binding domain-containing protein n=1 Tax=unclassified Paracoccus (in: a-proteobacteria) TaxID=2688777 RepID=UPI0037B72D9B